MLKPNPLQQLQLSPALQPLPATTSLRPTWSLLQSPSSKEPTPVLGKAELDRNSSHPVLPGQYLSVSTLFSTFSFALLPIPR